MLLNAMYGGLGQSLGAIIGGKMQSKYGTVKTFIYAGIIDAVFVVMLIAYLSVRKDSSFKNPQRIVVPPGRLLLFRNLDYEVSGIGSGLLLCKNTCIR